MGVAAFSTALEQVDSEYRHLRRKFLETYEELQQANAAKHALLTELRKVCGYNDALRSQVAQFKEARSDTPKDDKFRLVKGVLAKKLHPTALIGKAPIEIQIREKMFKEIWPEIERIERG